MADSKVIGYMEPLPKDVLRVPIHLYGKCSNVVINELNGNFTADNIYSLSKLCNIATDNFAKFLSQQGIEVDDSPKFEWKISVLKDGNCYRCINDTRYRFRDRFIKDDVWAYTSKTYERTFVLNDLSIYGYDTFFVHEMFHALSIYYSVFDGHADRDDKRAKEDERLARKFTRWLGMGE
jgi:hypothetical protein